MLNILRKKPPAQASGAEASVPRVVIEPTKGIARLNLVELWQYRELLFFLTLRDIKVRYKQTALGVTWALLQPLGMMVVFSIFFGKLANMPSEGIAYPIFVFCGLLPWQLFSRSLTEAANSVVMDQRLITRVYFPRLIVPMTSVLAALVDFVIAFVIFVGMMVYYGVLPTTAIWALPLFMILMLMTGLGMGLWLAALNVEFRDVRYVLPFMAQMWLFVTPVVYPSSLLSDKWQIVYGLNPMAGVVEGFRWALLGVGPGPGPLIAVSAGISILLFVTGIIFFRQREKTFADVVGSGGR